MNKKNNNIEKKMYVILLIQAVRYLSSYWAKFDVNLLDIVS